MLRSLACRLIMCNNRAEQDCYGAENMATLRRLAISLLKRESTKQSIATKRLMAAWDDDYLFRVLLAAGGG